MQVEDDTRDYDYDSNDGNVKDADDDSDNHYVMKYGTRRIF
jgi:hypothetical protein